MTAFDSDTDLDCDNSALADAPPPRVWNEASVEEPDTDSLELVGSETLTVFQVLSFLLKKKCLILDPLISAFRELDACELRPIV